MIIKKYKNYEVKELESDEYEDYVLWQSKESGSDRCSNLVLNDLVKYEYNKRTGCLKELDKYFTNNSLDIIFI